VVLAAAAAAALVTAAGAPAWELMGQSGPVKIVYIEPAALKDLKRVAPVVAEIMARFGRERPVQIDFFDDRRTAPKALPYTREQRLRQKAKFNFNPRTGRERFVRIEPAADPNAPDVVRLREVEESLPPPPPP